MKCLRCKKELPPDGKFCPYCGEERSSGENVADSTMKQCAYCKSQIPPDSRFCPECGKKITSGVSAKNTTELKKHNLTTSAGICFALVAVFAFALISSLVKPSINLNEYVSIKFEGYDTVGEASLEFDIPGFEEKYEKKFASKFQKDSERNQPEFIGNYDSASACKEFLSDYIDGSFDKKENLKNGDTVIFQWECDDKTVLNKYGYKLKYEDIEITVSGLEEVESFDPFDGLEVRFEGLSSKGKAWIEGEPKEKEAAAQFQYRLDVTSGLSNGDTIELEALTYRDDPMKFCIEQYGIRPSSMEKTITVQGLDTYAASISDISEASLNELITCAEEVYLDQVVSRYSSGMTFQGMEYLGNYFLADNSFANDPHNILYLLYKVSVHASASDQNTVYDQNHDVYWYIAYSNIAVNNQKEINIDATQYKIPRDSFWISSGVTQGWFEKKWEMKGYKAVEEIYQNAIAPYMDAYSLETNLSRDYIRQMDSASIVSEQETKGRQETISNEIDGAIFPESSDERIPEGKIKALSDGELRLAINEIYARHGYIFKDEALRQHFRQFDWYRETVQPEDFTDELLNETERDNIKKLQSERNSRT